MTAPILAPYNTIVLCKGSSRTLVLTVTDLDGNIVNLTGSTLVFTVKASTDSEANLFQKTSADPTAVLIVDARAGKANVYLTPADTKHREAKEYVYDVWVIEQSGASFPVIEPSPFVITPSVTVFP